MAFDVIIVDDEPWVAIDAAHSIDWERFGFTLCASYVNARAAIDGIVRRRPALVLTDICMPGIDGFELINLCRERGAQCHFAILTGHEDITFAQRAIRADVDDYFMKALCPEEMHAYLERLARELSPKRREAEVKSPAFQHALDYIRLHASEKLLLKDVADAAGFGKTYICALFKKHLNTTFTQYLSSVRLENAKELIRNTDMKFDEIALRCGIGEPSYFYRLFKKATGQTPAAYRQREHHD
ncbi:MAG: response regulator transcription factor [Christensenellales bacterium]